METSMGYVFVQSGKRQVLERLGEHLHRWQSTVFRQYQRILPPENPEQVDRIGRECDAFMLAVVLADLYAVCKAIRDLLEQSANQQAATHALDHFAAEIKHFRTLRDILQHLTEYERGEGDLQYFARQAIRSQAPLPKSPGGGQRKKVKMNPDAAKTADDPTLYDWLNMWTEDSGNDYAIVIGGATTGPVGVPMIKACEEAMSMAQTVGQALYQEIRDDLAELLQPLPSGPPPSEAMGLEGELPG